MGKLILKCSLRKKFSTFYNPTFAKGIRKIHNMKPLFFFLVVISLLGLEKTQASDDHPDCTEFKEECQALCLEQSGGVISAQCWGDPLYCYCKASDGTVFHIPGFVCEHPDCPPDA